MRDEQKKARKESVLFSPSKRGLPGGLIAVRASLEEQIAQERGEK